METTLSSSKRELLGRVLSSGLMPAERKLGIQPRPPGTDAPMSYGQQLVWLHSQFSASVPLYNEPVTVHRLGPLDRLALEKAFTEIVRRHEAWRTTFGGTGAELVQRIQSPPEHIPIPFLDVSILPSSEREPAALKVATEDALAPFDLAVGPLYRPRLVRFSEEEHRLFLCLHHIIFDGVSLYRVFLAELQVLYDAFSQGKPSPLEKPMLQFADYAIWHRKWVDEITPTQVAYWREKLKGVQRRDFLRPDHARTGKEAFHGAMQTLALDIHTSTALKDLSLRSGVTLFMTLQASFLTLIWAYTREDDLLTGGTSGGRNRTETENMMGFFLNTIVLRTDMSGDPTFLEVVQRGREELLDALANEGLPFPVLVKELAPQRDGSKNAFFQVSFSFEPSLTPLGPNWKFTQMDIETGAAKFDLQLELDERHDGIIGRFIYNAELFEPHTIQEMLETWRTIVHQVVVEPNRRISELVPALEELRRTPSPVLSDSAKDNQAKDKILYQWNDTQADFPADKCVHEMFEAQVAKTPDAPAVAFEGAWISYAELDRRANQLAHHLRSLGVKPDVRVAICMERGFEMVVALFAVLKAGGAYVPLDPGYPVDRLRYMLEDSAPVALLTQNHLTALFAEQSPAMPMLDLAAAAPAWSNRPNSSPDRSGVGLAPNHLAYVIYTSGSTGKPKGVMIEHRSLVNGLVWVQSAYHLTAKDAVLQKTPFSFDVSLWEFFWPLIAGSRLVMARPEGHKDPAYLVEAILENKITTLYFVPSMLQVFLDYPGAAKCSTLTCVLSIGEALPVSVARLFEDRLPRAKLHNLYGPTETTVNVTAWTYKPSPELNNIPIGKPIANTRVYVLDSKQQPVAVGESGELFIGGIGVARGYLNRPDLTAERFLPDPYAAEPGARMYRSGDLCRWLADGNLEYLGRNDFQVKIRGFRIELGEIEARLREQPGVRDAVVIARQDVTGDKRLVAYVLPAAGADLRDGDLREALLRDLPDYMVPSSFVGIDKMPLTGNGKLDRSALPVPAPQNLLPPAGSVPHSNATSPQRTYVPPSDALEAQMIEIWEEILSVGRVGVRDDFFQLGGHSLLAASMVGRIGEKLGIKLPLAALFHAPTIEKLAEVIRADGGKQHWSVLVPVQEHGHKPPLFLAHHLTGSVLTYYGLRHHIPHDQPLYGIQAQGLSSGRASFSTIPEMAAHYVREIRAFQPTGPYYLGGFSAGGLLAYEMAQQLTAAGEQVAFLALFDSYIEAAGGSWFKSFYSRRALRMSLFMARCNFYAMRRYGLAYFLKGKARNMSVNLRILLWRLLGNQSSKADDGQSSRYLTIPEAFTRAVRVYKPRPYSGSAVLFLTRLPGFQYSDPSSGWSGYITGSLEIREVEGDHDYLFREPYIGRLADQLNQALQQAQSLY